MRKQIFLLAALILAIPSYGQDVTEESLLQAMHSISVCGGGQDGQQPGTAEVKGLIDLALSKKRGYFFF